MTSNILICVTGGIAAYKAADICSALVKRKVSVKVIMTENAKKFITPLTLATLSKNPVYDDAIEWSPSGMIPHIELSKWCDVFVVVPATANTITKMVQGIADNLLTSAYLALANTKKVAVFPAMNVNMYDSEQMSKCFAELGLRPFHTFVQASEGMLACGDTGVGKLPPVPLIVEKIMEILIR